MGGSAHQFVWSPHFIRHPGQSSMTNCKVGGLWDHERNDSSLVGKADAVGPLRRHEGAWKDSNESESGAAREYLKEVVCVPEEWLTGASVVNVWLPLLCMGSTTYCEYLRHVGHLARPRSGYFDGTSDVPRGREIGAPVLPPKSPCLSAEVLIMSRQTQSLPFPRRLEDHSWSSRAQQPRGVRDAN